MILMTTTRRIFRITSKNKPSTRIKTLKVAKISSKIVLPILTLKMLMIGLRQNGRKNKPKMKLGKSLRKSKLFRNKKKSNSKRPV